MARPTKLTPELADVIVKAVEVGVPDKYAARAAGIHPATLIAWKHRGEAEASLAIDPDDYTKKHLLAMADERGVDVAKSWDKAKIADTLNAAESPFYEFSESLREAEARFLQRGMEEILKMSLETRDWRGILALMERRFPEVMGRYYRRTLDDFLEEADPDVGTAADADEMLTRGREITVKMIEAG